MDAKTTLAASVQAKKGRLYAVIQVKENGKTKPVWRALGLPEGTNKSKVNKAYREVVKTFENDYAEQLARNMCGTINRCQLFLFHCMEQGIERTFLQLEGIVRAFCQFFHHFVAVLIAVFQQ